MLIKGKSASDLPPLYVQNSDTLAFDDKTKCELLNQYFCSVTDLEDIDKEVPSFNSRTNEILSDIAIRPRQVN